MQFNTMDVKPNAIDEGNEAPSSTTSSLHKLRKVSQTIFKEKQPLQNSSSFKQLHIAPGKNDKERPNHPVRKAQLLHAPRDE